MDRDTGILLNPHPDGPGDNGPLRGYWSPKGRSPRLWVCPLNRHQLGEARAGQCGTHSPAS